MSGTTPPPGWYPDPGGPNSERYWDGLNWSNETRVPQPSTPPPTGMPNTGMPYSGAPTAGVAGSGAPESYLVWAIITTLLCCLPFGIVSIVNAVKVDKLWMQGQQEAAYKASKNAKIWAIVAAAAGGVVVGGWFLIALLAGMSGV